MYPQRQAWQNTQGLYLTTLNDLPISVCMNIYILAIIRVTVFKFVLS